jgi:Tol biopolymer transport system component
MQDLIGRTLGHYRIVDKIGAGGMGEVYRAHDERLDRDVAIKVLPEAVAQDEQRLARFEREAKLLASLSHQSIATLYGLEEHDGQRYLVMELVEGETLAERIKKGQIPVDDALEYARQIAEGLEAAHEQGIIHRDLKPANVMLSPEGKVKVLDFGLAKAWHHDESDPDLTHSPTLTAQMTAAGVLLGTAAYMSPEQARGKPVDRRTDNWAFGCVLYEMLTGRRTFDGDTVSDSMAAILKENPEWEALPQDTPSGIRRLLERCLRKSPAERLQHMGDARIEIIDSAAEPHYAAQTMPSQLPRVAGVAASAILVVLAFFVGRITTPSVSDAAIELSIVLPPEVAFSTNNDLNAMALSQDGRTLVFVGESDAGSRLYRRDLETDGVTPIPNTDGATAVTFSPEGDRVAFVTVEELRTVALDGSNEALVANLGVGGTSRDDFNGFAWTGSDTLVLGSWTGGLLHVPASGGPLEVLFESDRALVYPQALSGGEVLVSVDPAISVRSTIGLYRPGSDDLQTVLENGYAGRLLPTGHLLFVRDAELYVVSMDLDRMTPNGPERRVLERAKVDLWGDPAIAFSPNGTLAHVVDRPNNRLIWVDASGRTTSILEDQRFQFPRLSPDGTRAALTIVDGPRHTAHTYDLQRRVLQPLVAGGSSDLPIWTNDERVVFNWSRDRSPWGLWWMDASGDGEPRQITQAASFHLPSDVSNEGVIAFATETFKAFFVDIDGSGEPEAVELGPGAVNEGRFSPDGRYLAYSYQERRRLEVYIKAISGNTRPQKVSSDGGHDPLWSPDGTKLFYRHGRAIMAVDFDPESGATSEPIEIFVGPNMGNVKYYRSWDIHPDGDRFIAVEQSAGFTEILILLNWFEELKQSVPGGR